MVMLVLGIVHLMQVRNHALEIPYFCLASVLIWFYQGVLIAGFCFAKDAPVLRSPVLRPQLLRCRSATPISVFSFVTPLFGVVFARRPRLDSLSSWPIVARIGMALGTYPGHPNKIKQ